MKFLVVTNAPTLIEKGHFVAYAPYVNEMNIWFKNKEEVGVISPSSYPEPLLVKAFDRQDINFFKLPFLKLSNPLEILRFLLFIPLIKIKIIRSFIWADHIHLRCPGNVGLIASILQIFFPRKPKTVKYAGNWDPNSKQPWSYKLQKWILSNPTLSRNIKVLVYGEWPEQSKNIAPFFTASYSQTEKATYKKDFSSPFKFIFVGSLSLGKRPLFAIKLVENLHENGISVNLEIYGIGVMKNELQDYIVINKLTPFIRIMGTRKLEELKEIYKTSHFLILASKSEGWPKAIAEAMFFGCIPIATPVSCVPWMLDYGKRGIVISYSEMLRLNKKANEIKPKGNLLIKIIELMEDLGEMERKSLAAQEWSQGYTLEKFELGIKEILSPDLEGGISSKPKNL